MRDAYDGLQGCKLFSIRRCPASTQDKPQTSFIRFVKVLGDVFFPGNEVSAALRGQQCVECSIDVTDRSCRVAVRANRARRSYLVRNVFEIVRRQPPKFSFKMGER